MEPLIFVKKNVEVIAWKYDGTRELLVNIQSMYDNFNYNIDPKTSEVSIQTDIGYKPINNGDYIIRGINGEFFPSISEKFEKEFELSNNETSGDVILEENKQKSDTDNEKSNEQSTKPIANNFISRFIYFQSIIVLLLVILISFFIFKNTRNNLAEIIEISNKDAIERESKKLLEETKIECSKKIQEAEKEAGIIITEARIEAQKEAAKAFEEEMIKFTKERLNTK